MTLDDIQSVLDRASLLVRGCFRPSSDDGVPELTNGVRPKTVVIVGNAGSDMWHEFRRSPLSGNATDPMNTWSQSVLSEIADDLGADVVFPFGGPPHYPFQRWAQLAESVSSSPIGILIHPIYGLWHAYRGALLFSEELDMQDPQKTDSPCVECLDQPCLSTCPVDAFTVQGYAVDQCAQYLHSTEENDCLGAGCRARRACPVGKVFVYEPAHAQFHMQAFADSRLKAM